MAFEAVGAEAGICRARADEDEGTKRLDFRFQASKL